MKRFADIHKSNEDYQVLEPRSIEINLLLRYDFVLHFRRTAEESLIILVMYANKIFEWGSSKTTS